ncbi:trypsin-like peptidase [Azospirillum baldaniorum]|uniref:trypsin-like serine peptidase n=1 Tax=Azospirillum baldaniorum TaxID=1064539 RepID=UPI0011A660C8|nr:serine protease [Azospirillum baldaniorum]TWA66335.1 trypsin-like peptidase [Azospirillum baldaniorum]
MQHNHLLPASTLLGAIARRHGTPSGNGTVEGPIGFDLESADVAAEDLPPPDIVTDGLADTLDRLPADEIADPVTFARARDLLLKQTTRTLTKVRQSGSKAVFTPKELSSMEAVIKLDGTRPSLMLRDGEVPANHPFLGTWKDEVKGASYAIARTAASVGRIEPKRGGPANYFGTGFVIDHGRGLVLTNRHVLEAMWRRLRDVIDLKNGRFTFLDGAYIDFVGEVGSMRRNRFKVVEAMAVGPDATGNERLDAAVLKIRPLTTDEAKAEQQVVGDVPRAVPLSNELDGPLGQFTSFCVIGFPGTIPPPAERQGTEGKVDWQWVAYELMGGRHGVKRVAPGIVHKPLGSLEDDPKQWCFGHDATTLGGNSGSPVLAWKESGEPAFGLHFAGATIQTNYAHAYGPIHDEVLKTVATL